MIIVKSHAKILKYGQLYSKYECMALHFPLIFEHHEAFQLVLTTNKGQVHLLSKVATGDHFWDSKVKI